MMLLGKKVGMTQVYDQDGRIASVTVIQAGPCKVMQVKTKDTDGYKAVQIGFDDCVGQISHYAAQTKTKWENGGFYQVKVKQRNQLTAFKIGGEQILLGSPVCF